MTYKIALYAQAQPGELWHLRGQHELEGDSPMVLSLSAAEYVLDKLAEEEE